MSYRICVDQLPMGKLQADVMQLVSKAFTIVNKRYFVIGATARDILGLILNNVSKRQTADLDVTVCIETWEDFEEIKQALEDVGFRRDRHVQQRLYIGHDQNELTLDVVPYGGVAIPNDVFSWPGENDTELSVIGFETALQHTIEIDVDNLFSFYIPNVPGLFMLKLIAWHDRSKRLVYKDAVDMDFLIKSYFLENSTREDLMPVYTMVKEQDEYIWGAAMLAMDIVDIATQKDLIVLKDILNEELSLKGESNLLQNCLPQDAPDGLFDIIYIGWNYILTIISGAINQ